MVERERLVDEIYAAAWLPELWPQVLERVTRLADGYGAVLFAFKDAAARWVGTANAAPIMTAYLEGGWEQYNTRAPRAAALQYPGFVADLDLFSADEIEHEPIYVEFFRKLGLGWCAGTTIVSPSGDLLVLNIERQFERGPVESSLLRSLDPLRPHLARAALMSSRLNLERAQTAARTLEAIGLPAAIMGGDGRVLAVNSLFDDLGSRIIARAFGRVSVAHNGASKLLEEAVGRLASSVENTVCSIPLPADDTGPPLILHLVPVRREAHDIFARALGILVATPLIFGSSPPEQALQGLFDLTPAEAKVARTIVSGGTIEGMARSQNISPGTIRSQLRSVFVKTGTMRQVELVALLAGQSGFSPLHL